MNYRKFFGVSILVLLTFFVPLSTNAFLGLSQDYGFHVKSFFPCTCSYGDFMVFGLSDNFMPKIYLVNMPTQMAKQYTYRTHIIPTVQHLGKVDATPAYCWMIAYPTCYSIYIKDGTIQFAGTSLPGIGGI
ncbi:hypothetical protein K2P56_03985 [Patescibacteria group bacterium]|nr:hypothetical protein [Patescibacteria group bacterium]